MCGYLVASGLDRTFGVRFRRGLRRGGCGGHGTRCGSAQYPGEPAGNAAPPVSRGDSGGRGRGPRRRERRERAQAARPCSFPPVVTVERVICSPVTRWRNTQ
ncbi:hypothetical protein GCM10007079_43030 [Nocardiopsis terrae]|nr:hypothetical protein GCM10007079_43030 [Nocardiopsis terrae]